MKNVLIVLPFLLGSGVAFGACERPNTPANVVQKLEAAPIQMPSFEKNGIDMTDEEIANVQNETRRYLTEFCVVIRDDGLPINSKFISSNSLLAMKDFVVTSNGKKIGEFSAKGGVGLNRMISGDRFPQSYSHFMMRVIVGAIMRGELSSQAQANDQQTAQPISPISQASQQN